jgi:hypothetical protein
MFAGKIYPRVRSGVVKGGDESGPSVGHPCGDSSAESAFFQDLRISQACRPVRDLFGVGAKLAKLKQSKPTKFAEQADELCMRLAGRSV